MGNVHDDVTGVVHYEEKLNPLPLLLVEEQKST